MSRKMLVNSSASFKNSTKNYKYGRRKVVDFHFFSFSKHVYSVVENGKTPNEYSSPLESE